MDLVCGDVGELWSSVAASQLKSNLLLPMNGVVSRKQR